MSTIDMPELGLALPAAHALVPATLSAALPETNDWLHRILALDFTTYMPGSVLTKVDRAAMAYGLEVRPPMLDNEMIDWAFSLPSKYKVRGRSGKYLLKQAARGHLPDQIIDRPKKGFGIPLASWLRGPLREPVEQIFSRSRLWDVAPLDREVFRTYHREHQQKLKDRSKPLWALMVLDHWVRKRLA
jgi:asparagine synthase (glutamine-hydrolysing)